MFCNVSNRERFDTGHGKSRRFYHHAGLNLRALFPCVLKAIDNNTSLIYEANKKKNCRRLRPVMHIFSSYTTDMARPRVIICLVSVILTHIITLSVIDGQVKGMGCQSGITVGSNSLMTVRLEITD